MIVPHAVHMKSFSVALTLFVLFDAIWLGLLMKDFYLSQLGSLSGLSGGFGPQQLLAATFSYFLIVLGLAVFVFPRALAASAGEAFVLGALYGLIVYGVWNATNSAVIKNWPLLLSAVDVAWGALVCGLVTIVTHYILRQ